MHYFLEIKTEKNYGLKRKTFKFLRKKNIHRTKIITLTIVITIATCPDIMHSYSIPSSCQYNKERRNTNEIKQQTASHILPLCFSFIVQQQLQAGETEKKLWQIIWNYK